MQTILKDKTALVTGASRGLGRVITLVLGHAGANVVLTNILIEGQDQDMEKLDQYSVLAGYFERYGGVKTKTWGTGDPILRLTEPRLQDGRGRSG